MFVGSVRMLEEGFAGEVESISSQAIGKIGAPHGGLGWYPP